MLVQGGAPHLCLLVYNIIFLPIAFFHAISNVYHISIYILDIGILKQLRLLDHFCPTLHKYR
jgi:hypothetical protein